MLQLLCCASGARCGWRAGWIGDAAEVWLESSASGRVARSLVVMVNIQDEYYCEVLASSDAWACQACFERCVVPVGALFAGLGASKWGLSTHEHNTASWRRPTGFSPARLAGAATARLVFLAGMTSLPEWYGSSSMHMSRDRLCK